MRIALDLQVAQISLESPRSQYMLQLAKQLAAHERRVEVIVVLSAAFPDSIEPIRGEFHEVIPQTQIRVWYPPEGTGSAKDGEPSLRTVAEHLREAFISEMQPDLVVLPNLWNGWQDESVASLHSSPFSPPVAVILPELNEILPTMSSEPVHEEWQRLRLFYCRQADYLIEIPGLTKSIAEFASVQGPKPVRLPGFSIDERTTENSINESVALATSCVMELAERRQSTDSEFLGVAQTGSGKPSLAFVSPLPPEQSGIAYYSAELLPELAKYYEIDVVCDQAEVENDWIVSNCAVRSVAWFERNGHKFDRVVYQFGNSRFHAHMWELIKKIPGVAVVHDFYLGDAAAYREDVCGVGLALPRELYESHGYQALKPLVVDESRQEAIRKFPGSYGPIREANGVIVHSRHAQDLARQWYGDAIAEGFEVIPHPRKLSDVSESRKRGARKRLGVDENAFLICSFGVVNKTKLPHRLFSAWQQSKLRKDPAARLVYVGGAPDDLGQRLQQDVADSEDWDRISFTGWAADEVFQDYLSAADVAVQLRTNSRGETSYTVLDCMAHGVATICNAHGSFAEVPDEGVWKLDDRFEDSALIEALDTLWADSQKRQDLGERARGQIEQHYAPEFCAKRYHQTIEAANLRPVRQRIDVLRKAVEALPSQALDERFAANIAKTLPVYPPKRQILVDVSVVAQEDLRTGVQRVVRSILNYLLEADVPGYRVEPVYTNQDVEGYLYAREFTQRFIGGHLSVLPDEPMEAHSGDVFLGLDLYSAGIQVQLGYLEELRDRGVNVMFVVYDLLPVTHPQWFPAQEEQNFAKWLECITRFDGAICISQATADEVAKWMEENKVQRHRPYQLEVAHLGADISQSVPSKGLPDDVEEVLTRIHSRPTFLMVGTVEPRKGVAQVLDAFELLWEEGRDYNLVLVGKLGWNVDELALRLEKHKEHNSRLFWLQGISDEYLEQIYAKSDCLVAASEGEGFGLPLIEAAQHKISILARDIPVFREVSGDYADYFSANTAKELRSAIKKWHEKYESGEGVDSIGMPFLTWRDCAEKYIDILSKI